MKAIVNELTRLGVQVEEGHDFCVVEGNDGKIKEGVEVRRGEGGNERE